MISFSLILNYPRHLFVYHSYSGANKANEFGIFAVIFPAQNTQSSEETEVTEDQSAVSKAHFVFIRGAASVTKGMILRMFVLKK